MWLIRLVVLIALAASSPPWTTPQAWGAAAGTVVVAQGVDPTTLDPMNHQESPATVVANNLFDGLIERDPDLNLVPLLAESYQSVSPTTWEFKLRRGIRFHNGEPFDAESVKFSLERLIDPRLKLRGASAFTPLTHVEIVDPFTVRVHSKAGWPLLPAVLTTGQAAMLPPKYYRDKDMPYLQKNPMGSGPFKLVRWVKDDRIELEANEQYPRGAPPILLVGLEFDAVVLYPTHELEWSRAHRILLQVGHVLIPVVLGREHGGLTSGQHGGQEWPAGLAVHTHREGIHDFDVSQGREGRRPAQLEPGIDQPLEAELHGLGVEGLAVVEPDAPPELELPGRRAHAPVRLGQERDKIEVRVPLDQPIEEIVGHHGRRRFLMVHGIERGGVDALRDHHGSGGGAPGLRGGPKRARRCESDEHDQANQPHWRLLYALPIARLWPSGDACPPCREKLAPCRTDPMTGTCGCRTEDRLHKCPPEAVATVLGRRHRDIRYQVRSRRHSAHQRPPRWSRRPWVSGMLMPDTPPPSIGRRTGRMGADGASLHRHDGVRHAPSGSDQDAAARVPVGQGRDSALRESGVGELRHSATVPSPVPCIDPGRPARSPA